MKTQEMQDTNLNKQIQVRQPEVLQHLVNHAAFIDTAAISLWGAKRCRPLRPLQVLKAFPIGGSNRLYARCFTGLCDTTGNSFNFRYGRFQRFRRVPPFSIRLRSVAAPLTRAEVDQVLRSLMRAGYLVRVSQVELTFDRTDWSLPLFRRQLFTSARRFRELEDDRGWKTLYVGGPASPWQSRIYQKTDRVVRMEFIFRLPFLKARGIEHLQDLSSLAQLDLWHMVRLCELREGRLRSALRPVENGWKKQLLLDWPEPLGLADLASALKGWGINPDRLLRVSPVGATVSQMQKNLIW